MIIGTTFTCYEEIQWTVVGYNSTDCLLICNSDKYTVCFTVDDVIMLERRQQEMFKVTDEVIINTTGRKAFNAVVVFIDPNDGQLKVKYLAKNCGLQVWREEWIDPEDATPVKGDS